MDREDKFAQYRDAGVSFYWLFDPEARTAEGWKLDAGQYVLIGQGQGGAVIKFAPFDDLEIPLQRLWRGA